MPKTETKQAEFAKAKNPNSDMYVGLWAWVW